MSSPIPSRAIEALSPDTPVWIIDNNRPACRYYCGMLRPGDADRLLLSKTLDSPAYIHVGFVWSTELGALMELLEKARDKAARAQAEVTALELEMAPLCRS